MNFNIYLDDDTVEQLNEEARRAGESRNALVRQAVSEWLRHRGRPQWPSEVLDFQGVSDVVPFENARSQLQPPLADPLA